MRCRRIQNGKVVWFGSTGKNEDGTAKFYNTNNIHDNFSDKQQSVVDSLTQRLSVLKKELWYDYNYGMPLLEKQKSKLSLDSFIGTTILSHPDVRSIISFNSKVVNKKYMCDIKILSTFGEININL